MPGRNYLEMLTESKRKSSDGLETSLYSRTKRRLSPAMFISIIVTFVIVLVGVSIVIIAPHLNSHAAANTPTVAGTLNATLNVNEGTAQVKSKLTFSNVTSRKFTLSIVDAANNTRLLWQSKRMKANGTSTATFKIRNLNQLQTIPATWVATITDANKNMLGTAQFVSNGTTATATFIANTTTPTVTGTLTATLNPNAGTAQVQPNLTFTNFANQPFTLTITDQAANKQLVTQALTTDANGQNAVAVTINGLQGLTVIPATWVATITDANGNTIGTAPFVSNGTTATATFTATTTTTTPTVTGTLTATLNPNAGTAQVQPTLTFTNFVNQLFTLTITDQGANKQLVTQALTTDANGQNAVAVTINGLQGLTVIPATWVATITDANGKVIGTAPFVSAGTTATATFTVATTTTGTTTTGTTATTTTTVTGTLTATLNPNAGTVQVQPTLTISNFANQQFTITITDQATGKQLLSQLATTDANGQDAVAITINGLQGLTVIPATWVATITDANGNTIGTAPFVSNGTTATATFTAATTTTNTTATT